MRSTRAVLFSITGVLIACQDEPLLVYVPSREPEVELVVRASVNEILVGKPVVLRAERLNRGQWARVERSSLAKGQCWMGRPPPAHEPEVADNLRWEAAPSGPAKFNIEYRPDHTREVVFSEAGTFTLESSSAVWCRPDKAVRGAPITISVRGTAVTATPTR